MIYFSCALRIFALTALSAGLGALTTSAEAGGWPASRTLPPLKVVDSTGAVFGRYGGPASGTDTDQPMVYIPAPGGVTAVIGMARADLYGPPLTYALGHLYYTTRDCSGPGYIDGSGAMGARAAAVISPWPETAPLLFIADSLDQIAFTDARSSGSPGYCFDQGYIGRFFAVTSPPIDLSKLFTPPFHIQ